MFVVRILSEGYSLYNSTGGGIYAMRGNCFLSSLGGWNGFSMGEYAFEIFSAVVCNSV